MLGFGNFRKKTYLEFKSIEPYNTPSTRLIKRKKKILRIKIFFISKNVSRSTDLEKLTEISAHNEKFLHHVDIPQRKIISEAKEDHEGCRQK